MASSQGGDGSLAIFSALIINGGGGGGKLTNKNLKGVGEIHQGKRFLLKTKQLFDNRLGLHIFLKI